MEIPKEVDLFVGRIQVWAPNTSACSPPPLPSPPKRVNAARSSAQQWEEASDGTHEDLQLLNADACKNTHVKKQRMCGPGQTDGGVPL